MRRKISGTGSQEKYHGMARQNPMASKGEEWGGSVEELGSARGKRQAGAGGPTLLGPVESETVLSQLGRFGRWGSIRVCQRGDILRYGMVTDDRNRRHYSLYFTRENLDST
jgi:hypothetical protein